MQVAWEILTSVAARGHRVLRVIDAECRGAAKLSGRSVKIGCMVP